MNARDAGTLAERVGRLPVAIEKVRCHAGYMSSGDYPEGRRPTALVELVGGGQVGFGENVAFTIEEQRAFAARAQTLLTSFDGTVATLVRDTATLHERAALEGALVDLAMRQAGLSLSALAGVRSAEYRWVSSFDGQVDPAARLRALRAERGAREFKVDVDPRWSSDAMAALATAGGVVILDFKEAGTLVACAALAVKFPQAIFEDPPAGCAHPSIALDRSLTSVADVVAAAAQGRRLNLKAPRMGGVLSLLRALAAAPRASFYFGGMFEVGPGRAQARQLAALFAPDAPNDLGPLAGEVAAPGRSPAVIDLTAPGFGAIHDWATLPIDECRICHPG